LLPTEREEGTGCTKPYVAEPISRDPVNPKIRPDRSRQRRPPLQHPHLRFALFPTGSIIASSHRHILKSAPCTTPHPEFRSAKYRPRWTPSSRNRLPSPRSQHTPRSCKDNTRRSSTSRRPSCSTDGSAPEPSSSSSSPASSWRKAGTSSHTRSASTCSTCSWPSCSPSSTPPMSRWTMRWRTVVLAFSPPSRTRSSAPSSAASPSSSSGTGPPAPSSPPSSAVGGRSSTSPSSGPSWLCTGSSSSS
ncbi:hypothetical protein CT0861_10635, partial [Colletotrichum tofieldiae]